MRHLNEMELVMVGGAGDPPTSPSSDDTNTNNNNNCNGSTTTKNWDALFGLIHASKTVCKDNGSDTPASGSSSPNPAGG